MTSAVGAAARSASVGNAVRNCWYLGNTRSTCVCWSMISDTRIAYGSLVVRHGRSRCSAAYHESREACTLAMRLGAREKGADALLMLPHMLVCDGVASCFAALVSGWTAEAPLRLRSNRENMVSPPSFQHLASGAGKF